MSVRVRARLPKGDANGLAQWEAKLAADPDLVLQVVALVRADTIERHPHDLDDEVVVVCTLLAVEAPGDKADREALDGVLRETYSARTGKLALPFEADDAADAGKGVAE
jgi:hypothetical protein